MKSKRASSMPLNLIVMAIIVLVVLVIILTIFSGKFKGFTSSVSSCSGRGGQCRYSCVGSEAQIENTNCEQEGMMCCVNVFG